MIERMSHKDANTPRPLGPDPSKVFDLGPRQNILVDEKEANTLYCGIEVLVDWLEGMALVMTTTCACAP